MLYLFQMGPFMVLTTLLLQVQCSRQLSILELSSLLHLASPGDPAISSTVTFSSGSSSSYTCNVQPGPFGLPSGNAVLRHHLPYTHPAFLLPTTYLLALSLHPPHPLMFLDVLLCLGLMLSTSSW